MPWREDTQVAADALLLTPNRAIRQFRCLNGHSVTVAPDPFAGRATYRIHCDVCGLAFVAYRDNTRRHANCNAEHERRRRRKYPGELTAAPEALCHGR